MVAGERAEAGPSPPAPIGLRCNFLVDPLALRAGAPSFSWSAPSRARHLQGAWEVLVAGDEDALALDEGDTWSSGRHEGSECTDIAYGGPPLQPLTRHVWKVRIWGADDAVSPWSDAASFEVGPGPTEAWRALWIAWDPHAVSFEAATDTGPVDPVELGLEPVPYFRREFRAHGDVARARLYVTARGLYEARLNGQKVGTAVLAPGWTDYAQRLAYQAYDVTTLVAPGTNAIGLLLGTGWYCGYFGSHPKRRGAHYGDHPEVLAQLHLVYRDGTSEWVLTDASWKANWGAILHADPLMGERQYPALDPQGWDRAGFDDSRWFGVAVGPRDATPIVADPGPAVRVTETLAARTVTEGPGGTQIVDFGQNLTGWVRLQVEGGGGEQIRLRHGEMLGPDGELYVENLRTARQTDELWTSAGTDVFEPHFTWHGFRYTEVSGHHTALDPADICARVVGSDLAPTGTFECSDAGTNQLHANIDWGLRGNFLSIPTDCPQRDERLGWLGDAQIFARTATYLRDVLAFFDKWLDDVTDAQHPSGAFSDFAPSVRMPWGGAPAWADAGVIVPWTLWKMYGTLRPARRADDAMRRWMDFVASSNPDLLRTNDLGNNYGDWLAPGRDETPRELLATAYWAYDAALLADMEAALGHQDVATEYRELGDAVRRAFRRAFVDDDARLASGTQTAYALALDIGLLEPDQTVGAADHLVDAIRERDWHLSTGFVGVGHLLPALSAHGYSDVAYALLLQDSYPSWRYPISVGATTIWERWDGWTEASGFQSPHMNSFNHYSL
ncbi:MAG TPA: family 78 glycoside hydrolase catalytic domain, partial [Acidimicrobiales bacterium]|nr:family 78 glycoside hydrolase catalytic domain [Acidimicrobiales bacterium]